jgi:hypothetical protein
MRRHLLCGLFLLGVFGWISQDTRGDEKQTGPSKEAVEKAQKVISEHLEKIKGTSGQVMHLSDASLGHCFPMDVFFTVRFRQFPVAKRLPEGLRAANVFVVNKDGKLLHVKDNAALEKFFKDHRGLVKDKDAARETLASWLTLAQEFHQDGMYKFEVKKGDFAIGADLKAIGRAIVMQGGNGEINVTLKFTDGKLAKAEENAKIRPGPRPICQATKLLDVDPIVRRMAENDLLYLGDLVKDYLDEQRTKANPELRQAIDRIWQRILEQPK